MGMDVYGKSPSSPEGEYFRNNGWWWRPLASYILKVAPEEITSKCQYWHSNDGDGLGKRDSEKLAKYLQGEIDLGRTAEYEKAYNAAMNKIPDEPCPYCNATGIRADAIGVELGFPDKIVDTNAGHARAGKKGWCNGCNGSGRQEPSERSYPFSVENVQEFVTFLKACGGFEIC